VKKLLLILTVVASSFLTGCSSQSVAISRRAMVCLVYLEQTEQGYTALVAVRDFAAKEDGSDPIILHSAQDETPVGAMTKAACADGQQPFFARNRLLFVGERLADSGLAQLTKALSDHSGIYRNPNIWVWANGAEALNDVAPLASFIPAAEKLPESFGCATTLMQLAACPGKPVVPIINLKTEQGKALAVPVGIRVCGQDAVAFYSESDAEYYGLLRSRQRRLNLTVSQSDGTRALVQLTRLRCRVQPDSDGKLTLFLTGRGVVQQGIADPALYGCVARQLAENCGALRSKLSLCGVDVPDFSLLKTSMDGDVATDLSLRIRVAIRWE